MKIQVLAQESQNSSHELLYIIQCIYAMFSKLMLCHIIVLLIFNLCALFFKRDGFVQ